MATTKFVPATFNQIHTGDKFSARIQGVAVTGIVHKTPNYVYLCQNKKKGNHNLSDTHGYKYAWQIPTGSAGVEPYMQAQAVTHFSITKSSTPKVVKEVKVAAPIKVNKRPKKVSVTVDEEIASAKQKLANLEAKKAQESTPDRLLNCWRVDKTVKNGKQAYSIGCGAVTVTTEEAEMVATVLHNILTRTVYEGPNLRDKLKKTLKLAAKLGNNPALALS